MKWSQLADQPCSVARSVAVIGDRWTLMILRDCFLGIRRFDDIRHESRKHGGRIGGPPQRGRQVGEGAVAAVGRIPQLV